MKNSIKDVAAIAGVSQSTVSRVLNKSGYFSKDTSDKVMRAMEQLDYKPSPIAVSLSKSKTRIIAFIVPDISISFFSRILLMADEIATRHGYRIILCNSNGNPDKERAAIMDMISYKVCSLIIVPVDNSPNAPLINNMQESGTPAICMDRILPGINCDSIKINNRQGIYEMVSEPLRRGYTRIAALFDRQSASVSDEHYAGFEKAMRERNAALNEEHIFYRHDPDECRAFVSRILSSPNPPDAIVCMSSNHTVCGYRGVQACGLSIPKDVFLVGFDDYRILEHCGIKVVNGPSPEDMGKIAMRLLLERLESGDSPPPVQHIVLQSNIQISESVLQPRRAL